MGRKQKQQQKKKNNNYYNQLGVVVQTLDSGAFQWINHYPADGVILISVILFHWIVIYPVDSAIQCLNNQGLLDKLFVYIET